MSCNIENTSKNFSICLPAINNKKRLKFFSSLDEIEEFIEYRTEVSHLLDIMNIQVYYKNINLGVLSSNKDKAWKYCFKMKNLNKENLKVLYSYYYEEDSYVDEQILPEYKIYEIKHLKDVILVTTYEYEDYGTYDFLIVNNNILGRTKELSEYVEKLLFS